MRPGSRRRAIVQADSQRLVIALRSPPEKGAANDELIAFVAQLAGMPRSAIKIMRGTASRHKVVWIATPDSITTARRVVQAVGVSIVVDPSKGVS